MAKKSSMSIGKLILQIGLGVMLAIAGIWALQGGGDTAAASLKKLFGRSDAGKILVLVFGIIELLAGIFLVVELFIGDRFGSFGNVLEIIVIIVWIVAIVLMDFLGGNLLEPDFLSWLYSLAVHCAILGGLLYIHD